MGPLPSFTARLVAALACAAWLNTGTPASAAEVAPAAPRATTTEARPQAAKAPKVARQAAKPAARQAPSAGGHAQRPLDHSGQRRRGKASFYAGHFAGKKMADGQRMDPQDDNAASKTLPLGTRARVTNLETGQQAVVTIQDRGPYVKGRIIDLSPSTARRIGISRKDGLARVEVAPITVPLPDGRVKAGAGARRQPAK